MLEGLTGIISGAISGMGMGGGTILITILVCFLGIDQKVAQAVNLVFFIPTSIVETIVNIKNKEIDWKLAIPISILGAIGAFIGAYIATKIQVGNLRKLFAIFLIVIAIFEAYSWYKKYVKKT